MTGIRGLVARWSARRAYLAAADEARRLTGPDAPRWMS